MKLADFDYELPQDRIARYPAAERDASRLMVLKRDDTARIEHARFRDLTRYLNPGDLLVVNDTRVIPARLVGRKESGGRIEILLVEPETSMSAVPRLDTRSTKEWSQTSRGSESEVSSRQGASPIERELDRMSPKKTSAAGEADGEVWSCMAGFSRAPIPGAALDLGPGLEVRYLGPGQGGLHRILLRATNGRSVREAIDDLGQVPLPPYIERNGERPEETVIDDALRYQTVYAERDGAIAAPTAGLHFTRALLSSLEDQRVEVASVTLHVGPATFVPMRAEDIEDHPMPGEKYEVPKRTVEAVAGARARGGRVVAVGTTTVRALESASDSRRGIVPARGRTDLFIHPGHRFRVVDALITNFHLPRSSLLLLVSAFAGRERVLEAYRKAIHEGYRFYSYGDAMLIV